MALLSGISASAEPVRPDEPEPAHPSDRVLGVPQENASSHHFLAALAVEPERMVPPSPSGIVPVRRLLRGHLSREQHRDGEHCGPERPASACTTTTSPSAGAQSVRGRLDLRSGPPLVCSVQVSVIGVFCRSPACARTLPDWAWLGSCGAPLNAPRSTDSILGVARVRTIEAIEMLHTVLPGYDSKGRPSPDMAAGAR